MKQNQLVLWQCPACFLQMCWTVDSEYSIHYTTATYSTNEQSIPFVTAGHIHPLIYYISPGTA